MAKGEEMVEKYPIVVSCLPCAPFLPPTQLWCKREYRYGKLFGWKTCYVRLGSLDREGVGCRGDVWGETRTSWQKKKEKKKLPIYRPFEDAKSKMHKKKFPLLFLKMKYVGIVNTKLSAREFQNWRIIATIDVEIRRLYLLSFVRGNWLPQCVNGLRSVDSSWYDFFAPAVLKFCSHRKKWQNFTTFSGTIKWWI